MRNVKLILDFFQTMRKSVCYVCYRCKYFISCQNKNNEKDIPRNDVNQTKGEKEGDSKLAKLP